MAASVKVLQCVFALILVVENAYGLKCYSCNSKDSVQCGWGFASFTYSTEECASLGSILDSFAGAKCFKVTATNKQGKEYIARGCLPPATVGCSAMAKTVGWFSSQSDESDLKDLACDTCDTDKCNSAQKMTAITMISVAVAVFALLF